jgi:hypothetical protein
MLTVLVPFAHSALLVAGMVRECINASERKKKTTKGRIQEGRYGPSTSAGSTSIPPG